MLELLASWHLNYLLHSTVLLLAALLIERTPFIRRQPAWREALWRVALLGGLFTASWQLAWPHLQPQTEAVIAQAPVPSQAAPVIAAPVMVEPATELTPSRVQAAAPSSSSSASTDWRSAVSIVTLLWLPMAALGLLLLALRWLWLRGQVARLPTHADARLQNLAARLARRAEVPTPTLRLSKRWQSPLVAPGGAICLPEWVQSRLDEPQREAVLAHELAHLRRRDPAWRLLTQGVMALAWMQPLNRLAAHRLDTLAELACDAWAARSQDQGLALAESLYVCASHLTRKRAPRLAAAMGQPRSALLARIQTLLENRNMNEEQAQPARRLPWRWIVLGALLTGGAAAALAPAFVLDKLDLGWLRDLNQNNYVVASSGPEGDWRVQARGGMVEFNEAEDEITKVSGVVTLSDEVKGLKRKAEYTPTPDGKFTLKYSVNGKEQPLDEAGRLWMKTMVQRGAEALVPADVRAARLYAKGGVPGAIAWLDRARSDYQRRAVIQALLQLPQVGPLEAAQVQQLIATITKMSGDFDRREAYVALIEHQLLSADQQQSLLAGVAAMDGDFDRRTVLEHLSPSLASAPEVLTAWQAVIARIGSDFDRRTAIEKLMALDKPTPAQVDAAMAASLRLGSDFDHRTALIAIGKHLVTDAQLAAYTQSAGHIGGDFDRREALVNLIETQPKLSKEGALAVITAIGGMGSSFDATQVLVTLAGHMPNDAAVLAAYRARARDLPDHERGQVEKALDHLS